MEYLDICDENGIPTGETVSRDTAHREGILHRTAHVWIVRKTNGRYQVMLQKRSMEKESFPGLYDTSSAGHIPSGELPLLSALRELYEELGISADPGQLVYAGSFRTRYEKIFHGKVFRDNEATFVYVYTSDFDENALSLQKNEVDEVRWFYIDEIYPKEKRDGNIFCVPESGLAILIRYLEGTAVKKEP